MAFGNAVGQGFNNPLVVVLVIEPGKKGGIFVYYPVPGAGNLVGSWVAFAGTDKYGNAYPAGLSVVNAAGQGVNLNGDQVIFQKSNAYAGGGGGSSAYLYALPASAVNQQSVLFNVGPTDNVNQAIFQLRGETEDASQGAYASLFQFDVATNLANGGVPLALVNVASQPSTLAGSVGALLYSFAGHFKYTGTDTNQYDTGRLSLTAAGQTLSAVTAVPLTGLSATLGVGIYRIDAELMGAPSLGAGTHTYSMAFTGAATGFLNSYHLQQNGSNVAPIMQSNSNAVLTTNMVSPTQVAAGYCYCKVTAEYVVTVAGTLTFNGLVSIAADTFTLNAGSHVDIYPIA